MTNMKTIANRPKRMAMYKANFESSSSSNSLMPISGSDLVAWKHQVYRQIGSNPILMRCIRSFQ
ncbi:hypothetical protein LOD44_11495 [Xylella fastidiosa subsp. multiplex]|uniref:hypothetical protein n=1 Tax=Xylella fastidiosa TaxID=2371 RepID=UPI0012AC9392|nr:hypothetical protein [Xylella fastidiosa]KAJ4851844.1 hypothetical protein XYFPCFBP8418_007960 [Xylella fastidiosa subsp. multiplex]KAJ4853480.1 hypothetical protein XYFPCFBP8418_004320 [Xylella fastidiosa subsp. multiplex]MBE0269781.1 hypothetical protein [Xylella fastidiosa subsp. multiplex]MBE0276395.1 hypothetical protein [Xylella fastidiosa subsp. multiplex]MBE0278605.1 hypothetical protein [Xylella fastidiosa subsp. multiplex]